LKTAADLETRMIKNLLLGLDASKASKHAETIALRLAERHQARITALSVVDQPFLTLPHPGVTGRSYQRFMKDVRGRLDRASAKSKVLLSAFRSKCQRRKLPIRTLDYDGDPYPQILDAAAEHDLIVIARDANFHTSASQLFGLPATTLLRDNPRPLVLCCPGKSDASSAVIAYDGSVPSMRAVQMFALLGGLAAERVHVVTIDAKPNVAEARARRAAGYLGRHGISAEFRGIASNLAPAEVLLDQARGLGGSLLVMGAYGRTGWRETLFGSCTRSLLRLSDVPLFVYH
jgi:nucleotide-binding universal stress UspA family protein